MDEDLYDEFGNYIGPDLSDQSQQRNDGEQVDKLAEGEGVQVAHTSNEHRIILHEDKKYYQAHEQMYPEAEIMIEQEDRQALETPIVQKLEDKKYNYAQTLITTYSTQYMQDLMKNPALVRNVAFAGHLHHGKTILLDMLIQETHVKKWNMERNYRWLDTRFDEQERQLSIQAMPITLMLADLIGKHYVLNCVDTPGHPNFSGEVTAACRITDGVVLVVDVIEGVMMNTEKIIRSIIRENLDVIVVINKIDRLIIEMKIPPEDAYLKIKHTLEQINGIFVKMTHQLGVQNRYLISPSLNNVVFASAQYSFMFSLESMTRKYTQLYPSINPQLFGKVLWGDYYFNSTTRKFTKTADQSNRTRTFVEFILDPIYKIFAHSVGKDRDNLQLFLAKNLNISLTPEQYKMNIKSMIKLIFRRYFKTTSCLISAIVQHIRAPNVRNSDLINRNYRGDIGKFKEEISKCSLSGPLFINVVKMYNKDDYKTFDVLGRVLSGTIDKNSKVKIMGENYVIGEDEDVFVRTVQKLYLLQGRFKIQVQSVCAGNIVLIEGLDQSITKTATILDINCQYNTADIMIPLKFWTQPVVKVAIEPLIPSQLPKMIEALRRVNKRYPLLKTKVEESGEHVLIGTGQLHLDCILHDIRNLYSDIEVRISDPCVLFSETVAETSGIPCYADTPNKKNRIKTLAGPLDKAIADSVEKQLLDVTDSDSLSKNLEEKYDWDILASKNVWSFGPDINGTNVLINDTLPTPTDQTQLNYHRNTIVQGFKWSTREGPLCDQPMRNVKFRVIQAEFSKNAGQCPAGQLIPTARRAFYSAFLTANPRMMEPVFLAQIQCTTSESIQAVFGVLAKRRGSVQSQTPKAGTPHYIIKALIPCIQTLGFETDLRVHTVGQAFCVSTFDHWQVLPGDPLDKKIVLRPLEALQAHQLAREFMIKTRRRKGLNEEVSIVKYFDDFNIKQLLKNDITFKEFI